MSFEKKKDKEETSKRQRDDSSRQSDRTIAPHSINIDRDTVYRVGGADPYGAGNYYSQDQLNNNMSGPDANAIQYATNNQRYGVNPDFANYLRDEGLKVNFGAQSANPIVGQDAYVAGAGAYLHPWYDEALPMGVGSAQGIPRELLDQESVKRKYAETLMNMLGDMGWLR